MSLHASAAQSAAPVSIQSADSLVSAATSLSRLFTELTPAERLAAVAAQFPDTAIIATNGGVQSRVIPVLCAELLASNNHRPIAPALERIPFVIIDTGDLFPETLAYARRTSELLQTKLFRVGHDLTPGEFKLAVTGLIDQGQDPLSAFDQVTKVRVLKGLRDHPEIIGLEKIEAIVAGNRRDQAKGREDLEFVEAKNGILYFYPLADQTSGDIDRFIAEHNIEPHPLRARGYLSIGNQFDTRPVLPGDTFEKDSRHGGGKSECGIHLGWLAEDHKGRGARVLKEWTEPVKSPRPEDGVKTQ